MKKSTLLDYVTLFTASSTLICCALPALLVAVGAGSVMASLVSTVPGLVWISKHKIPVFIVAGILLLIAGYSKVYPAKTECPIDESTKRACKTVRTTSNILYFVSLMIYIVGGSFAFVLPRFM